MGKTVALLIVLFLTACTPPASTSRSVMGVGEGLNAVGVAAGPNTMGIIGGISASANANP